MSGSNKEDAMKDGPSRLSLSVLGSFECILNGEEKSAEFRTKKERALLVYLVVAVEQPHQREALGEMFWPGKPDGYARTNLRQALWSIRRVLQDQDQHTPFLLITDDHIRINPESCVEIDCQKFDRVFEETSSHQHMSIDSCSTCIEVISHMVDLYQGEFLEECLLPNAYSFQEWVMFQREHFFRRLLTGIHTLIKHYQDNGEIKIALDFAYRQAKLAPLEESAHRQLMKLLAMDGRRSAAMEQYQVCCRVLSEELDVNPDLETTALYEKIKAGLFFNAHRPLTKPATTNLPVQFTKFVGREDELTWAFEILREPTNRLVTVTGISGVGKTRFSIQLGARLIDIFSDGVWFIPLNSIHAVDLIAHEIAQVFQLDPGESDHQRFLIDFLRSKNMLLIIDNFEHLLDGTTLLLEILQAAPGIKILVTSQRRLSYQAAHILELKGLPFPEEYEARWDKYEAIGLFLERAKRNQPNFRIKNRDVPHLIHICKTVDGLPLGLELAAAGLRFFSCEHIAAQLQSNIDILTTTMLDVPERHRSLRAAFDQSWTMLPEKERDAYRRLSVFQGEFSVDQAVATTGASLTVISALVDRSLIQKNSSGYYLIQPMLRQYAAEKLEEIYEFDQNKLSLFSYESVNITRDPITGLPNKVLFRDLFKQSLALGRRRSQYVALLIVEIENISSLIRSMNIDDLNLVIKKVAEVLIETVRDSDTVAHLVTGKFAIILEQIVRYQDGAIVTGKIRESLDRAFIVLPDGSKVTVSMGVSVYPNDSEDIAELLNFANIALNEAKLKGENYKYYTYEKPMLFSVET